MDSVPDLIYIFKFVEVQEIKPATSRSAVRHLAMQNLHSLQFLAEAFLYHVQHFQCLVVPVELAVLKFVFRFMVVVLADTLCVIESKRV